MLSEEQIEQAAQLLKSARLDKKSIDCIPEDIRPSSIEDAYAVQSRFLDAMGWDVEGWFLANTNVKIQELIRYTEPFYGRRFTDLVFASPADINVSELPPIDLECEFGFSLKHDLPKRGEDYSQAEVEDAIATVHPTIDIVAPYLKNWTGHDIFSIIADNSADGALVYGEGVSDWQALDLINMDITLSVGDKTERQGTGSDVMGDPVAALVWMVNARANAGDGLRAGCIHHTGTATALYRGVKAGDEVVATFDGLGAVSINFIE
jgi:2-keto-4-pentenoate hydratase